MTDSPIASPQQPAAAAPARRIPWQKLALESFSVLLGVVLGTQVSNWNADRKEAAEIRRVLDEIKPGLEATDQQGAGAYYATTRAYADTALAGWARDPKVSDNDFVIAAYQASQIVGSGTSDTSINAIFGGEKLLRIEDRALRNALIAVVARRSDELTMNAVDTPYRHNVRSVMPEDVQDAIRNTCGDRLTDDGFVLPKHCDLVLPPQSAARAAATLRARPTLADDLRWHISAVNTFLLNRQSALRQNRLLYDRIVASERH